MITATVHIDLSRDSRENDRRAITTLYAVPAGARVVLFVGDRVVTGEIHHFREYVPTLHLDVHGTLSAVENWTEALRGQGIWGDG